MSLSYKYFFTHFFAISFIAFENIKNVKQNLFLIKKIIAAQFNKRIATWRKKSIDSPREEFITADPEEDYHWGLKENPITEDPKENPITKKPKADTITVILSDNSINEDPHELQDPQWLLRSKWTLFGFLVMVYDRVGDGDKISKENLGLGRPHFHTTSHLKIEAKVFFS